MPYKFLWLDVWWQMWLGNVVLPWLWSMLTLPAAMITFCPSSRSNCLPATGCLSKKIVAMSQTLHLMKFFLCTAYGDSSTSFQGVCQGNGAGLAACLALSISLIHMLHTYGHTSTITCAITVTILTLSGLLYVDISDLFILADSLAEPSCYYLQTPGQYLTLAGGPLSHCWFSCRNDIPTPRNSYPASLSMLDQQAN